MQRVDPVDCYIANLPADAKRILSSVREAVQLAVPEAEESMHHGMPAYRFRGQPIAYFAVYKHHFGYFATPLGFGPFEDELAAYSRGKGSVKFRYDEPIPLECIANIARRRYHLVQRRIPPLQ